MTILEGIDSPADLRNLNSEEMQQLAAEIREYMLEVVSENGGHLAPNLGVVELTIALHTAFNTPQDKIVWDVGHQCYTHKILTGRREQFKTLRQTGGISGFPKREESEYDVFNTGHSSTSVSVAFALAKARDLMRQKHEVIAVVGDGALTGGMAFEALNHAGDSKTKLIVILNDNKMSIASNVGALSKYLMFLRTNPRYGARKKFIDSFLRSIPGFGPALARSVIRLKDSLKKYFLVQGMLFEDFGFTYLGPVNGHDIRALTEIFQRAKNLQGPVLIHVLTKKGMGYEYAQKQPEKFHGIGAFDLDSGIAKQNGKNPSYTKVFSDTLLRLGTQDDKIVAITASMPEGTGMQPFSEHFPKRAFDVGIAEGHATTFAAGLASVGFKPIFVVYSTFLQRAYDQILHDVCQQNLPVVFAVDRAGLVGADGCTHQGTYDLSFARTIPGLTVMAPKDENELQHMLYSAVSYQRPALVRYPRGCGQGIPLDTEFKNLPYGKAEVLRDPDHCQLTIFACGTMVYTALAAAQILHDHGIEAQVVNARFVAPIDRDQLLQSFTTTGHIVTVEENEIAGGFGEGCAAILAETGQKEIQIEIAALPATYFSHAEREATLTQYGLDSDGLVQRVLKRWFS